MLMPSMIAGYPWRTEGLEASRVPRIMSPPIDTSPGDLPEYPQAWARPHYSVGGVWDFSVPPSADVSVKDFPCGVGCQCKPSRFPRLRRRWNALLDRIRWA